MSLYLKHGRAQPPLSQESAALVVGQHLHLRLEGALGSGRCVMLHRAEDLRLDLLVNMLGTVTVMMERMERMEVEMKVRAGLRVVRGVVSPSKILIGLEYREVIWLEIYCVEQLKLVHRPARSPQGPAPDQPSSQAAATHLEAMRLNPRTYPTLPLPLPVAPTHKEKVAEKKKLLRFGILHFGEMGLALRMGS